MSYTTWCYALWMLRIKCRSKGNYYFGRRVWRTQNRKASLAPILHIIISYIQDICAYPLIQMPLMRIQMCAERTVNWMSLLNIYILFKEDIWGGVELLHTVRHPDGLSGITKHFRPLLYQHIIVDITYIYYIYICIGR